VTGQLVRVAVRVPADEREQAIAALLGLELAPQGFEEVDRSAEVEFGIYTDTTGEARIRGAFGVVESVAVAPGWEDGWRAFHRPAEVAGLWIGPPWLEAPADVPSVVIDPGRAFGTGAHPTTRLCIELLAGVPRGSFVDVGCGSGVLSIAAARLGFSTIVAVDVDPVAVEVTRANAAANGVALEARVMDATATSPPSADVAVANVTLALGASVLERLDAAVAVTSGYLDGEVPAHTGWSREATLTLDGWAADRFARA
jgi:ribosomal protein L11 methyltransferase